jgi:hypothetical protein
MKVRGSILWVLVSAVLAGGCASQRGGSVVVSGELKQWHDVVLTFKGPLLSEQGEINPFRDCRMNVTFAQGEKAYVVPGYFAADGNAGQTGADAGDKWRVHFLPPATGEWTYSASFRYGQNVALDPNATAGKGAYFDGTAGAFTIEATDKVGRDFRAQGLLQYVGQRYMQFAGTKTYFLKGGADSPENFLAYADFDDTFDTEGLTREGEAAGGKFIHAYKPHVEDWRPGDPTWRNGKGKGIIGALNYLASKGMNSVYFLTYNVDGGDGKDVWMWTHPDERYRFDCSKLDQWEIVFSHMDRLGLMLHVVTQEQENDQALDKGNLGAQRKLYYRELIARFTHHPAVVWNLGEENTNTTEQRKAFARYIHELDPYDHPVVCHTYPGQYNQVYEPLLGYEWFEGPSLQTNDTHTQTLKWVTLSAQARRPWLVCLDEIGPSHTGVKPDNDDFWHDEARIRHLWGNLMAGGAGVEWYFGYNYTNNDLNCESWHSRDHMWEMTRFALEFFHGWLPFATMAPHDELTTAEDDYCLADPGNVYAVYLPAGGAPELDLGDSSATFEIHWFNPRKGGSLQTGTVVSVTGPGKTRIGQPQEDTDKDWAVLVERTKSRRPIPVISLPEAASR